MKFKIFYFLIVVLTFAFYALSSPSIVLADHIGAAGSCTPPDHCIKGYSCQPTKADPKFFVCQPQTAVDVFGKIKPPDALKNLIGTDPTGALGISKFLSNLVTLIYSLAAVVLIFMLLWGAFDWLTSEGDKEKLESAKRKLINAIIGIMLFAVAFAVIQVLGSFTGFKFFEGQK